MKSGYKRFTPLEIITLAYALLTVVLICFSWGKLDNALELLLARAGAIAGIGILSAIGKAAPANRVVWFLRNIGLLGLILYWYPETYYLGKCILPNLDQVFMDADAWLFGCQPSLEFSKAMPYTWFNELMNFGYFSYFFMILGCALYFYIVNKPLAQHTVFVVLCAFFFYYLLFIIMPVMGPQFYFKPPDNQLADAGIFRYLVKLSQSLGEKPTGAFPSSHVGICIVNLILLFKYARKGFYALLPVALLLVCSTVYIKAHYLIDVFAGFVTAPLFYWLSCVCWKKISGQPVPPSFYKKNG